MTPLKVMTSSAAETCIDAPWSASARKLHNISCMHLVVQRLEVRHHLGGHLSQRLRGGVGRARYIEGLPGRLLHMRCNTYMHV